MFSVNRIRNRTTLAIAIASLCVIWPARSIFSQAYGPPTQPPAPAAADQPVAQPVVTQPADANAGVEPLTSGPVHEAFAEPLDYNAAKPLVVSQEPPALIDEVPPDVKPEGTNVMWIPGYWGWDDDRRSFIWISGIWRDAPAGQVWVSGYWTPINGGYQWVPGFWTSAENQQVNYLPEPPAAPTEAASTPSPGDNYFWVPGIWVNNDARYVWRAGYWAQTNPDWVWQAAHYCWTPQGYVYIAGYWDYPLVDRGVLFAPVAFTRPVYAQARFAFTPQIVIDAGLLTTNFFIRPDYCHYYFGDFYGRNYANWGIQPWFSVRSRYGYGYDPLFAYYRSYYSARDPGWFNRVEQRYTFLNAHPEARPPRTWLDARRIAERGGRFDAFTSIAQNNAVIAAPLADVVNRRVQFSTNDRVRSTTGLRFANLAPQQRQEFQQRAATYQQFAQRRAQEERPGQRGPLQTGPGAAQGAPGRRGLDLSPLITAEREGRPGARIAQRPNLDERTPGAATPRPGTVEPGAARPGERAAPGVNPRTVVPNEPRPRGINPRETLPRETTPREGTPREATPREPLPREANPREPGARTPNQPRETLPRDGVTPRETVPREGNTPREAGPRDGGPRPVTPREAAPREVAPRETPRENAPRDVPREARREPSPRDTAPRDAAPREVAPRQPAPREATPREATPREATPRQPMPQREPMREAAPPRSEPKPNAESKPNPGNRPPRDGQKDGQGKG